MKRYKNIFIKISLCFVMLFSCLSLLICRIYAYTEDSNGNLVSDNILQIEDVSKNAYNVTITVQNGIFIINGTATGTGPLYFDCSIPSGSYTLSVFNSYISSDNNFYCSMRYTTSNQIASSVIYCDTINDYSSFTANQSINYFVVRVASGVTYNNVILKPMLVSGSSVPFNYEPYGQIYYSQQNYNNALTNNYGIFSLCSSIDLKLSYINTSQVDTYSWGSILELINDKSYVTCNNGVFSYNNSSLSMDLLGGSSNATAMWQFNFEGTYPLIRQYPSMVASGYDLRYQIVDTSSSLFAYGNIDNNHIIDLMDYENYQINYFQLFTGAVGIAVNFTSLYFETNYNLAYTRGYEEGKTQGYDEGYEYGELIGFENGKNNGYDIGYNDGFSAGEQTDFASNGFKSLLGSIFDYPINMIKGVFNFEFMGINIASLIMFIVSIGIVLFVIKQFRK